MDREGRPAAPASWCGSGCLERQIQLHSAGRVRSKGATRRDPARAGPVMTCAVVVVDPLPLRARRAGAKIVAAAL